MARERLLSHRPTPADGEATVRLDPGERGPTIDPKLYAKFVEHLYSPHNVKNTLEAQVLYNPTVGSWKFQVPSPTVDGGRPAEHDPEEVAERIEQYVERFDLPGDDRLREAYRDGTALWWFPYGETDAVRTSPDVGTARDRAQRVEVEAGASGSGIAQWCYLPLHRTRTFEGTATLRAMHETAVTLAVHEVAGDGTVGDVLAEATVEAGESFSSVEYGLELPAGADDSRGTTYAFSVTADGPANVVVDRVLLYPDDHVHTADPEVVELLSDAHLPLLRWPGGNFVSGYRWEDGIGPIEERPTKPNPAWDGLETNLFGTAEFVEFCDEVGCEPMICLNAGDGTAAEAARWVEYCNGDPDETEMGALRAEHGYEEPFDVTYWEVGNEVYGPWQTSWTTPGGYADRFRRFYDAMTAVDDSIEVLACGNRLTDWNEPVVAEAGNDMDWITDHALVGGTVDPSTEPEEIYNAYTGFAEQLGEEYGELAEELRNAGVEDPRLALTELQLFARPGDPEDDESEGEEDVEAEAGEDVEAEAAEGNGTEADDDAAGDGSDDEPRLTFENMPINKSIAEAVYDATIIHECARRGEFVGMVTHSGAGNHGGGLQKRAERVWADPAYYHHKLAASLFDGTPVGVELACDTFSTETTFGDDTGELFGQMDPVDDAPVLDVLGVLGPDESELTVVLVHRDARTDEVDVTVDLDAFDGASGGARVRELTAETMSARNTLEEPENVTPSERTVPADDDGVSLAVSPFSVVFLTVGLD